jgi:hypothetical protein
MADYQVTPTYHDTDSEDNSVQCIECGNDGKVDFIDFNEETGQHEVIDREICHICNGTGLVEN